MDTKTFLEKMDSILMQYRDGAITYSESINAIINNAMAAMEHGDYLRDRIVMLEAEIAWQKEAEERKNG